MCKRITVSFSVLYLTTYNNRNIYPVLYVVFNSRVYWICKWGRDNFKRARYCSLNRLIRERDQRLLSAAYNTERKLTIRGALLHYSYIHIEKTQRFITFLEKNMMRKRKTKGYEPRRDEIKKMIFGTFILKAVSRELQITAY